MILLSLTKFIEDIIDMYYIKKSNTKIYFIMNVMMLIGCRNYSSFVYRLGQTLDSLT
jgi:hypothetical protein